MTTRHKNLVEICWSCDTVFHPHRSSRNSKRHFCSFECRAAGMKGHKKVRTAPRRMPMQVCACCTKEFRVLRSKHVYCSRECSKKMTAQKDTQVCKNCGSSFVDRNPRNFCSRECFSEHRAGEKTCATCSLTFIASQHGQIHCSPSCYHGNPMPRLLSAAVEKNPRLRLVCDEVQQIEAKIKRIKDFKIGDAPNGKVSFVGRPDRLPRRSSFRLRGWKTDYFTASKQNSRR